MSTSIRALLLTSTKRLLLDESITAGGTDGEGAVANVRVEPHHLIISTSRCLMHIY